MYVAPRSLSSKILYKELNYECVVSEYQIVSNQKFFEIEIENGSKILNIGCFPVCEMVQPDVNAYWRLDFTECSDDTG